jgi:hypothetical protein
LAASAAATKPAEKQAPAKLAQSTEAVTVKRKTIKRLGCLLSPTITRPQDQPCALTALPDDDRALIRSILPELGV